MIKKIYYIALLVLFLIASCSKPDESVFYIPAGYNGPVMIVFDQENGIKKEYEDGKRVYRIPENGILETQFESNLNNIQSLTFYYLAKDKKRIPIEYLTESRLGNVNKTKESTSYVFSAWSGSSGHTNDNRYKFETFLIGNISEKDSLLNERMSMTFEYQKKVN